jgi:hypothetical protein
MKKLIFIPLCLSLFFTSCKNDEGDAVIPVASELDADMRGEWTNTLVKRVYYSDRDTVMYADSSVRNATFYFDGKRMTVTLPGSATKDVWEYNFPDKDKGNYIMLKQGSQSNDYMINSVTDTEMIWVDELPWAGYPEEVPDNQKTTSKVGVYTWKFIRKK